MDLIALAVPFFLLALLIELAVDRWRGTGYYRLNDAINSLSAGALSTTIGYFTKLLPILIWGSVLQHLALFDISLEWFDFSPRGLLLWLLALIAFDFCYYWTHRFGHEMSVMWAAHAVHHQSEEYNLSTALRQTSSGFLLGWIFYLPLFLIGLPLEVVVAVNAVDLIYQFWVHTQHIGKLGVLDRVLVTPSNHRVHHAQNERYIDKNYGGIFIIWDRLFGTFQEELDTEPVVFGVRKPLASWNPFWANFQVYHYLWFDAKRTRRWRDKIGIWFRRTGWRPADMEERFPKVAHPIDDFQKYDPAITTGRRRYIFFQFFCALLLILWIAELIVSGGLQAVAIPCALLWVTLYSIGVINDARAYAKRLEILRLLIAVPLLTALLPVASVPGTNAIQAASIAGGYIVLSLIGLQMADRIAPAVTNTHATQ
ncbi:MAG: sterol desaturase family protein [Woeseia sp.]|nr:sterol desaturase family protein [Woeseia sp.]MBT8096193.1 sterol desaturase family protein [Woeseia sp.]NNE60220.1 sterol desaturase family protein [Woeseia sp.]NNL56074.1 sterol desaturase family protein [Woeseia sp.]